MNVVQYNLNLHSNTLKSQGFPLARRADHSREELRDLALAAAQELTARHGLSALTARHVAKKIGYSTGTLYNVFENFTDLAIQMNGQTLDTLYQCVTAGKIEGNPEARLKILAHRYIAFTTEHANLWSVIFEPSLPRGDLLPAWYHDKMRRLLALVDTALLPLFGAGQDAARQQSVQILWSSLHGICSLVNVRMLVTPQAALAMADTLIEVYVAGLRKKARKTAKR